VALTSEGQLIFEEDREGSTYGVRLNDRNFLNGARHSVYYEEDESPGSTEIQLGGLNTTDPRFTAYKGYTGCLSNVIVSINGGAMMKPLEEYMLFTKKGSETVRASIPAGVRSAQCAVFHAQPRGLEPPRNDSVGRDRAWVEDPPARVPYKSIYNDETKEEQGAGTYIFIVLVCVFVFAVLGCIYEVIRSARRDRKRRRARASAAVSGSGSPGGSKRWQPTYANSVVGPSGVKTVGFKTITEDEKRPNGTHNKISVKEYKSVPNSESKNDVSNDKKVFIKDEESEKKELLGVNTGTGPKPAKPNPFSMEDLTEEPELEEREQEEEEDDEEEEDEVDKSSTSPETEAQVLVKPVPVRNQALKRLPPVLPPVLPPGFTGVSGKRLLETNFSITGLNEIKTNEYIIGGNETKNGAVQRPLSLDFSEPTTEINNKTRPESLYVEKVTAKMFDVPKME
ncbi:GSCOCG00001098001-RA-CDS, partial [Cotesia congregata]